MKKYFLLTILLLMIGLAKAEPKNKSDLVIFGVGTNSCGEFLKAQELDNPNYGYHISWLQGYLTAVNLHSIYSRQNLGSTTDIASMMLWLTKYCNEKPLDDYTKAVISLTGELK